MKCKQTYLTYWALYFSFLLLLCGSVIGQSKITYDETQPKVPKVLLGSWVDEEGIYRIEIQNKFCGADNQLWKYRNIEEREGGYFLVIENEDGAIKDYTFSISNTGKISLKDPYLWTLHLRSDAFSDNFHEIQVNDLPANIFGHWRSNSSQNQKLEINVDGVKNKKMIWKFHQIFWVGGFYRIILRNKNTFLLWEPKWRQEGQLSDVFMPSHVMTHWDASANSNTSSQVKLKTKSLKGESVFNAPINLQIEQMPSKFFGNWNALDGRWKFGIKKEVIEIEEVVYNYNRITLINGQYEIKLELRDRNDYVEATKTLTFQFITDNWIEIKEDGDLYEVISLPNENFLLANSDTIQDEILGDWLHLIEKDDRFNLVINSDKMTWKGYRIGLFLIKRKDNIYYFTGGLKHRFRNFKVSLLENGYLHVESEGESDLFSRELPTQFLGKRARQIIGGLILLTLTILGISRWRTLQNQKEERRKHRELELELKALRSQMNPHFLFNSLSSIQNLINKQDPEQANIYLSKFSRLLRSVLNNSESPLISLEEEVDLLTLYCELEALRFKFDFEIEVASAIDIHQWEIPVMLIQPFVENAIHHGIGPSKEKGKLKISFSETDDLLQCAIVDNGVGINYSQSIKGAEKIGKKNFGIRITEERIKMLNKQYGDGLKLKITDIGNSSPGKTGTQVDLILPSGFN